MDTEKRDSLLYEDNEFISLLKNMGINEHKKNSFDKELSRYGKIRMIASTQSITDVIDNLKNNLEKSKESNNSINLEIIKCYLDLGKEEIYKIFVLNNGVEILEEIQNKLTDENSSQFYSLVYTIIKWYGSKEIKLVLNKVCKVFTNEAFEILETCIKRNEIDFMLNYEYLELLIQQSIASNPLKSSFAIKILSLVYENCEKGHKIFIRYFLFKNDFFEKVADSRILEKVKEPIFESNIKEEVIKKEDISKKDTQEIIMKSLESILFGALCINSNDLKIENKKKTICNKKNELLNVNLTDKKFETEAPKVGPGKFKGPPLRKKVLEKVPQKKTKVEQEQSYPQIHWTKVAKGNSVWKLINLTGSEGFIKEDDLYIFEKKKKNASVARKTFIQPIFDQKKNNAINIALGRVKYSDKELKEMILSMKLKDENIIKQIYDNFPTNEELMRLRMREKGFGRAETFFKECVGNTEYLKESLGTLYFISILENQNIAETIKKVQNFYNKMTSSKAFFEFIKMLLFVGNLFNKGTLLGNAEGFSLNGFGIFNMVRGSNKESVLEMVTRNFMWKKELLEDIKYLHEVSTISLTGIEEEMSDLRSFYLKVCGTENKKLSKAIESYKALASKYEGFKREHQLFEEFIGAKVDRSFYESLSFVYKAVKDCLSKIRRSINSNIA